MHAAPTHNNQAYVMGWLRQFGGAVSVGRWGQVRRLAGGRGSVTWEFPAVAEARLAMGFIDTLAAMTLEDAGAASEREPERPAAPGPAVTGPL
jgi:hypothetical protein